jgi:hypothetical protein
MQKYNIVMNPRLIDVLIFNTFANNLPMIRTFAARFFLPLLLLSALAVVSCRKKDKIDTDPSLTLSFSTDTVFFDTVFTSIGSVTQRLTIYNKHDGKVSISNVMLAGGESSNYRINIDGQPVLQAQDVEIPGHDSIFIFIRVTVDPNNENTPFVVSDSIVFLTNGNPQDVKLMAWGQNARFLKNGIIEGNQVWDSLKPYVIFGHARVDTSSSLTILAGTKVYFHWGSHFDVSDDATLNVIGSREHPVRFQGDRLDPFYRDLPGQWGGIYLERGSKNHSINYAVIKNGTFGLSLDSLGTGTTPGLVLDNTIIQNTTSDGIYAYSSAIVSTNCVVGNTGGSALDIEKGGSYDFRQLTIANYWSGSVRLAPSLYLSNYSYDDAGNKIPWPLEKAFFGNAIIYGIDEEEIYLDILDGTPFEYTFDHAILKTGADVTQPPHYLSCTANEDPLFVDPNLLDFHIDSLSPAIGKGIPMGVTLDLDGNPRGAAPGLGAYEFIPGK